jgi:hypothetical protein
MTTTTEATTPATETEAPRSRSVVAPAYKVRYRERAATAKLPKGTDRKVVARSCGDWLSLVLARETVTKRKSDRQKVAAILEANGVAHDRWAALDNGRFRMTGGLALRRVVAEAGVLVLPEGREERAPKAWCAAHQR